MTANRASVAVVVVVGVAVMVKLAQKVEPTPVQTRATSPILTAKMLSHRRLMPSQVRLMRD
jgi:hypothetical protein